MNGQLLKQGYVKDATPNEGGEVCPRNKPNLSGKTNKGEI
jgi:hypothetical protein